MKAWSLQVRIRNGLEKLRIYERWPLLFEMIHVRMAALHGANRAAEACRSFTAETVVHLLGLVVLSVVLSIASGAVMIPFCLLLMVFFVIFRVKSLDNQVKHKRRRIVLELPELLNKITLLLHAGETLHQAIHRSCQQADETHPLYKEWVKLSRALKDNRPFIIAMEEFSRSCGVLEVSMFSTNVLMNFKRGGSDFAYSLEELSHTLWERRKAAARTIGEEASAKMVFPMVLLFCTVMLIVAAPAVLSMQ